MTGEPGESPATELRVSLLGEFRIRLSRKELSAEQLRLRKARRLFALLALSPGHRLHREQVMETLWPGVDPRFAANRFYYTLHTARSSLAPLGVDPLRILAFQDGILQFCPDFPLWVDVEAFEAAAAQADQGQDPALYRAALSLYAGDLLSEDLYEDWTRERRQALRQSSQDLTLELGRLFEAGREYEPAIAAFQQVLAQEPAHEDAHVGLMRAYALSGQRRQALRQYQRLQEALRSELEVEPDPKTTQLYNAILTGQFPPLGESPGGHIAQAAVVETPERQLPTPEHNLPIQLTSFIGREAEIAAVRGLLAERRLVTLTGAGGVGKTRLAIRVAEALGDDFPDGVWFVDLAHLTDPGLVAQTIAAELGLREEPGRSIQETLTGFLSGKQALLVLDNCEHLIEACARLVDALLHSCTKLKILASSREVLGVAGETVFRVPSMGIPGAQQILPPETYQKYDAIRLFIERAQAVLPTFEITDHNAQVVIEVCQRLDGIPLAIELAAARVNLLRVEQIARRLEESFSLLASSSRTVIPRHKTLRATIDWSYNLLSEKEQILLRRLSVFSGGCMLGFVEAVCTSDGLETEEILDLLASLVNKSMLFVERKQGVEARYTLLDTVYRYAREKLEESVESLAFHDRHLVTFLEFAETAEIEMYTVRVAEWIPRVMAELDNLRVAIQWSYGSGTNPQAGLRIGIALGWRFMPIIGHFVEAKQWLLSGIGKFGNLSESLYLRARSFCELGWLAANLKDWPQARQWYEESIRICQEVGSAAYTELAWALWGSAYTLFSGYGETMLSKSLAKESVAIARRLGTSLTEQLSLVMALSYNTLLNIRGKPHEEELADAQREAEESLFTQQRTGIYWYVPAYWKLADVAFHRGDYQLAYMYNLQALAISRTEGARPGIANTYSRLSSLSFIQGNYLKAFLENLQFMHEWHAMGSRADTIFGLFSAGIILTNYVNRFPLEEKQPDWRQAAVLLGSARNAAKDYHDEDLSDEYKQAIRILGKLFDVEELQQAWAEGQAMSLDEAVKLVLSIHLDDQTVDDHP